MNIAFLGSFQIKKGSQVFAKQVAGDFDNNYYIFGPIIDIDSWRIIKKNIKKQSYYDEQILSKIFKKYQIDLVIIPSIWEETFSITFFQAALSGIPVIHPKSGYPYSLLKKTDYPFFYDSSSNLQRIISDLDVSQLIAAKNIIANMINKKDMLNSAELKYDILSHDIKILDDN